MNREQVAASDVRQRNPFRILLPVRHYDGDLRKMIGHALPRIERVEFVVPERMGQGLESRMDFATCATVFPAFCSLRIASTIDLILLV